MTFQRPEIPETRDMVEILSPDTADELMQWVSSTTRLGKMIGDLFLAYRKGHLVEWTILKEADEVMPYYHSEKNQIQLGYRLWWLSRLKNETNIRRRVYHGCWLDKKVVVSGNRDHIKQVKLCVEAIECFTSRQEIFEELYL